MFDPSRFWVAWPINGSSLAVVTVDSPFLALPTALCHPCAPSNRCASLALFAPSNASRKAPRRGLQSSIRPVSGRGVILDDNRVGSMACAVVHSTVPSFFV